MMPHQPIARGPAGALERLRWHPRSEGLDVADGLSLNARQLLGAERLRRRGNQSVVDLAQCRQQVFPCLPSGFHGGWTKLINRPHRGVERCPDQRPWLVAASKDRQPRNE
jgi:hypothetical protein